MTLWSIMIGNAIITCAWLAAMVYLISTGHPIWGGLCFVGAVLGGYQYKRINP